MSLPIRVSVREAELLAVARALVSPDAYATVEATLMGITPLEHIGPSAKVVLEATLAKGGTKTLARLGGAELRLRPGSTTTRPARVFEVRPPPKLAFGRWTFALLRWLTATPLGPRDGGPPFTDLPATLGDQVMAYLALRLVAGRRLERAVASAPGLACPLAWLGFPKTLARHGEAAPPDSFADLCGSTDAQTVLACLGPDLRERWASSASWDQDELLEAEKAAVLGAAEGTVLDRYLDAVASQSTWDLATFVVEAGARVLPRGAKPREIAARAAPPVRKEGTLRSRSDARRRAGALFRALVRLGKKRDDLALVRFMDDDYELAQALLSAWEVLPREAFTRAEAVVASLGSLDDLGAVEPEAPAL